MIPGARVVALPGSRVAHLYTGPLTPAGRFVPGRERPVCGATTVGRFVPVTSAVGVRPCVRCGRAWIDTGRPPTRDAVAGRYAAMTAVDVALAARYATTLAQIERVQLVALVALGWVPLNGGRSVAHTEPGTVLALLRDRRHTLALAARTEDDIADDIASNEAAADQSAHLIGTYNDDWSEIRRRARENYRDRSAVTGGRPWRLPAS